MEEYCYGCIIESMSQKDHNDCGGCLHNIENCELCSILNIQNKINKDEIINEKDKKRKKTSECLYKK